MALACSLHAVSEVGAVSATWSDELDLEPNAVRPDGNRWRNYPPGGEADGSLNALVRQTPQGTWRIDALDSSPKGSVPWNGNASNKGPLQNMSSMTFQFRFKLGSDPVLDPDNVWEPFTELDGIVPAFIQDNSFVIEQETRGTIKWFWRFGYEVRPDSSFPLEDTTRGVSMQFHGKTNGDNFFDYIVTPWDSLPLLNNQWYVGRVVADWRGPGNPASTISLYFGTDESSLQLIKREDADPSQQYTASLSNGTSTYEGDYNLEVIKSGLNGAVEFDYFRAYAGALSPQTPLDPAGSAAPGDFNGDGEVDGFDLLAWQRGASPTPLSAADYAAWQQGFGKPAGLVAQASIPEPSAATLVAASLAARLLRRRRSV